MNSKAISGLSTMTCKLLWINCYKKYALIISTNMKVIAKIVKSQFTLGSREFHFVKFSSDHLRFALGTLNDLSITRADFLCDECVFKYPCIF